MFNQYTDFTSTFSELWKCKDAMVLMVWWVVTKELDVYVLMYICSYVHVLACVDMSILICTCVNNLYVDIDMKHGIMNKHMLVFYCSTQTCWGVKPHIIGLLSNI